MILQTRAPAVSQVEPGAGGLRAVFRRHAAGVAIITAAGREGPVGFTATSLASVSVEPPLLSFNVSRTASSWPALAVAGHLAVHILRHDQAGLAALFSTPGADRFGPDTPWTAGPWGLPVLSGCAGVLVAATEQRVSAGDHAVVIARVLHGTCSPEAPEPLIRHDGRYLSSGFAVRE
jgi:flavin reductase (DIM6/NTAB) family NADH-FMN oxidoreductase RutF